MSYAEPAPEDLELVTVRSRTELASARAPTQLRVAFERLLCDRLPRGGEGELPGICQACVTPVVFRYDWLYADEETGFVNFRERLICPRCELNTRQRVVALLLRRLLEARGAPSRVYLYEQVTPFFRWADRTLDVPVI